MIIWNKIKFAIQWRAREWVEILNIRFIGGQKILVYTMGKVGSTSTYYAIKKILGGRVLFVHFLKDENIRVFDHLYIKNKIKPIRHIIPKLVKRLIVDKQKSFKTITLIRDPIERNISKFFQSFNVYNNGKDFSEISVDQAINNFIKIFPHDEPIRWLHEFYELTKLKRIDFDKSQKFKLVNADNGKVLIMRTDLDDDRKEKLIQSLLKTKNIRLERRNTASNKRYSVYYKAFLDHIIIPNQIIEALYNSIEFKEFYTTDELIIMKQRWSV